MKGKPAHCSSRLLISVPPCEMFLVTEPRLAKAIASPHYHNPQPLPRRSW